MKLRSEYISIAIADDNIFFREGLISVISQYPVFSVKVVTDSCSTLLENIVLQAEPIDICIIDISIPESYETLKLIKKRFPDIKVLVMTMYNFEMNIIRSIKIGANGFLLKESGNNEIYEALVSIFNTGNYYSPLLADTDMPKDREQVLLNLSYREMEYMSLCCSELSQKAIADKMNVKVNTVNSFRDSLFKKLNVRSRVGIVLFALKIGMMPLQECYKPA